MQPTFTYAFTGSCLLRSSPSLPLPACCSPCSLIWASTRWGSADCTVTESSNNRNFTCHESGLTRFLHRAWNILIKRGVCPIRQQGLVAQVRRRPPVSEARSDSHTVHFMESQATG